MPVEPLHVPYAVLGAGDAMVYGIVPELRYFWGNGGAIHESICHRDCCDSHVGLM